MSASDADGDGVQDSKDDCDLTPAGVTVDENGCEIDTDGDGSWILLTTVQQPVLALT